MTLHVNCRHEFSVKECLLNAIVKKPVIVSFKVQDLSKNIRNCLAISRSLDNNGKTETGQWSSKFCGSSDFGIGLIFAFFHCIGNKFSDIDEVMI